MLLRIIFLLLVIISASPAASHGDVLCRVCGHTLFSQSDHVRGSVLTGPRVVAIRPEPLLGEDGALHDLRKNTGGDAVVSVSVFDSPAAEAIVLEGEVKTSVFNGFSQRLAKCARCDAAIGWQFTRTRGDSVDTAASGAKGAVLDSKWAVRAVGGLTGGLPPSGECTRCKAVAASGVVPFSEAARRERLDPLLELLSTQPFPNSCLVIPRNWWSCVARPAAVDCAARTKFYERALTPFSPPPPVRSVCPPGFVTARSSTSTNFIRASKRRTTNGGQWARR